MKHFHSFPINKNLVKKISDIKTFIFFLIWKGNEWNHSVIYSSACNWRAGPDRLDECKKWLLTDRDIQES